MTATLHATVLSSIALDNLNHLIALGIICMIYILELFCIYLDRHKQAPKDDGSKNDYKKYYGKILGICIYNCNKLITICYWLFSFRIPQYGKPITMVLSLLQYIWKIFIAGIIISVMFFKNIVFKLLFSKLFTMTVLTGVFWMLYNNYIKKQNEIFEKTQMPLMLVNIYGSSVYQNITFNDIQTSYTVTDANIGLTSYVYRLKDYYINACNKPYIIGGADSLPTTIALQYIVNAGARYMTFDIFEDLITVDDSTAQITDSLKTGKHESDLNKSLYVPNVRSVYISPDDGIPFVDMIKALAYTKPFSPNPSYPLILHLNFWSQESKITTSGFKYKSTYDIVHGALIQYFGDKYGLSGSTEFGFGGKRSNNSSLCDIPIKLCYGKVLVVSNNVYQYNGIDKGLSDYTDKYNDYVKLHDSNMASIIPYIYATINVVLDSEYQYPLEKTGAASIDPNILIHHYTRDQLSEGITGGKDATTITSYINSNKTSLRIAIPKDCPDNRLLGKPYLLRNTGFNPRVLDLMNAGVQVILMNYQYMGQEIENYLQIFSKTSFVLKPQVLREMPPKSVKVNKQSSLVSYAAKSFALKGVMDESLIF